MTEYPEFSFADQINSDNLDRLLEEEGLTIAYTHFSMTMEDTRIPFWETSPDGNGLRIRPEADEQFALLDSYRDRGLWLAPAETIFDRMLAIDSLQVTRLEHQPELNRTLISLYNPTGTRIEDLCAKVNGQEVFLGVINPNTTKQVIYPDFTSTATIDDHEVHVGENKEKLVVFKRGAAIVIRCATAKRAALETPSLYNIKGQLIKVPLKRGTTEISMDMRGKASGLYFVKTKNNVSKIPYVK